MSVIVNGLEVFTLAELNEKTAKELRALCAQYNLSRYSKANKTTLLEMIRNYYEELLNSETASNLRIIAGNLGYTGISKTTKANLIDLILNHTDADNDEIDLSSDEEVDISGGEEIDISTPDKKDDKITVIYGAKNREVDDEGKSVWDIHANLASVMGLPQKPDFRVNDAVVNNNYIPTAGDSIEFFRTESGNKG